MEAPFGTCDKKSPPMSSCRLRCKSNFVNATCGCVDAYMKEVMDGKKLWMVGGTYVVSIHNKHNIFIHLSLLTSNIVSILIVALNLNITK